MSDMPEKKRRGRPPKRLPSPGEKPKLTDKQWLGAYAEAQEFDPRQQPWPSHAKLEAVAAHAGVSHSAVSQWRKREDYRAGLIWAKVTLDERLRGRPQKQQEPSGEEQRHTRANKDENTKQLRAAVEREWQGPTVSPLDGKLYVTPEAYIAHIADFDGRDKEHPDMLWIPDPLRLPK